MAALRDQKGTRILGTDGEGKEEVDLNVWEVGLGLGRRQENMGVGAVVISNSN